METPVKIQVEKTQHLLDPCRCVTRSNSLCYSPPVSALCMLHEALDDCRGMAGVPSDEMGDGSANPINTRRRRFLNGVGPRCILFLLAISRMSSHALPPNFVLASKCSPLPLLEAIRTAWRRSPLTAGPCATWRRPPLPQ